MSNRASLERFKEMFPAKIIPTTPDTAYWLEARNGWTPFNDIPPGQLKRIAQNNLDDLCFETQDAFVRPDICNQTGDVIQANGWISTPHFLANVLDAEREAETINDLLQEYLSQIPDPKQNSSDTVKGFLSHLHRNFQITFFDNGFYGHSLFSCLNADISYYHLKRSNGATAVILKTPNGLEFFNEHLRDIFDQSIRFLTPLTPNIQNLWDFLLPSKSYFTRFIVGDSGEIRPQIKLQNDFEWTDVKYFLGIPLVSK